MTKDAAVDTGAVICDAYADLVAGDTPVFLAVASSLHIPLAHLQICLIKIHIAGKHYPILRASERQENLAYPVSRCVVCLSVCLRNRLEALLRKQPKAGVYPFAYRLLMVLEECPGQNRKGSSAVLAYVSTQSRAKTSIPDIRFIPAVWALLRSERIQELALLRIGDPGMPVAVFLGCVVVKKRLKRRC